MNNLSSQALEILRSARETLANPDNFTPTSLAVTPQGIPCASNDPLASKWGVLGALLRDGVNRYSDEATHYLRSQIPEPKLGLYWWETHSSHAEILAFMDRLLTVDQTVSSS